MTEDGKKKKKKVVAQVCGVDKSLLSVRRLVAEGSAVKETKEVLVEMDERLRRVEVPAQTMDQLLHQ